MASQANRRNYLYKFLISYYREFLVAFYGSIETPAVRDRKGRELSNILLIHKIVIPTRSSVSSMCQ